MFEDLDIESRGTSREQAFDILQDLEQNTPEELRRKRAHFRIAVKASVTLQAGNSSQLLEFKVRGVLGDISESGCCALFPVAARVGDVYRLEFDRAVLDLPMIFARCLRCRLVREEAYESGFRFFAPISLPETVAESAESALG